jgi:starch phosphorylase
MAEAMGADNMFVFGLRADQVTSLRQVGYKPNTFVERDATLQRAVGAIAGGEFSQDEPARHRGLMDELLQHDRYMLMADFASYRTAQEQVDLLFAQSSAWSRRVVANIAGMGGFSSDRTVREYVARIWSPPA